MSRRFTSLLNTLPAAVVREVEQSMYVAGEIIAVEAQVSITEGAVSGSGHVASKPGEAPNADTHYLADNIEVRQTSRLKVEIASTADYSAALEFGTSRMSERPFMRPAARKKRLQVNKLLSKAARRAVRKHFRR